MHHDHDHDAPGVRTMIQGEVSVFLSALGAREGDLRLRRALEFVGGQPELDVFDDGGEVATYLAVPARGVELLLTDGALSTVFVHATATEEHAAYDGWAQLLPGIDADSSREDVIRAFGEPKRSAPGYLLYGAGSGFVQFDFAGEMLAMAVVMERDINGG